MTINIIESLNAIKYFNEEAENLLKLLVEMKEPELISKPLRSIQEEVIQEINEREILYSFITQVDKNGNETGRYFNISKDKWLGIDSDNYEKIEKMHKNLYKRQGINRHIGKKALLEILFEWMKVRVIGSQKEQLPFTEYLNKSFSGMVKDQKISIPIINMAIDLEFSIGNVKFEYMNKQLFDEIEVKMKENVNNIGNTERNISEEISSLRKKYQGKVVATVNVFAETEKAIEIAEKEVDRAIAVLKFYSPSAFALRASALFGRKGLIQLPIRELFIFSDSLPTIHQGFVGNQSYVFKIDRALLGKLEAIGFTKLSGLISDRELSSFEELILSALYMFTKAISYIEYHEKIVFVLSALEIVLLKDSGEPIQIHVGQRLGFLINKSPEERKRIVDMVGKAYSIRSNYIHHGRENEDNDVLIKLQRGCWSMLNIMIQNHDKFKGKDEFVNFIENLIYS